MEYELGTTIQFREPKTTASGIGYNRIRQGTVNGDSLEAKEGVFYPVWVEELSNTIYVHFDNIIES